MYQSYPGESGSSKSADKLAALKVPESFEGMRVLDLGCNMGFFCRTAVDRGAAEVVGIDRNEEVLAVARERVPEATFLNCDFREFPEGPWDLVFFLSAIHYAREPRRLLSQISESLSPTGKLVLETGVGKARYSDGELSHRKSTVFYPTEQTLVNDWLQDFAVRRIGLSVNQVGDPTTRWVFHASRRQMTVLLLGGSSFSGKSVLGRDLDVLPGTMLLKTDDMLLDLAGAKRRNSALLKLLGSTWDAGTHSRKKLMDAIEAAGLVEEFAKVIVNAIPLDSRMCVIEGEAVRGPLIKALTALLGDNARLWNLARSLP